MKRFAVWLLAASVLMLLAGCQTDRKQAAAIQETLEQTANIEKTFRDGQQALAKERERVRVIYDGVLQLDHADADAVRKLAGSREVGTERGLLEENEAAYREVRQQVKDVRETAKLIKDDGQRKQADKLAALLESREKEMAAFFAAYHKQLDAEDDFFAKLEQGQFDLKQLDADMSAIHEETGKIAAAIDRFNTYTNQFNAAEEQYFNSAGVS
ncbi:hypothetical protein NCCP2716_29710 [Sporosarcina sp. NCCP-2716]|uniref:YkyA family protein n=1 Tax=Sporosarcina sp. NCCP-2716 TaxID=2943679 RepID=UPI00203F4FE2|nr:YkyA family protein [Sporosarcina sp. NCCP-2716]GKV70473.1 hypothetical protein NCCP2716_29710 [Sporosarcina sp. NCCP-2716]